MIAARAAAGNRGEALRAYERCRRILAEELGVSPSPETQASYVALLSDVPVPDGHRPRPPDGGIGPSADPEVGRASELVGRHEEMSELLAALTESRFDARFVIVEGEPGIGKTKLLDELRRIAGERAALAVWGRSDESGAAPALWPWLVPLRAVARQVASVPPPLAGLLAADGLDERNGQAAAAQLDLFEAIAELIGTVTSMVHLVVLLDDLQWADEASVELLSFLAGRAGPGLLVVGAVRQLEVGRRDTLTDTLATVARRPGSRRLELRGLTELDTVAVLATTTGHPVKPEVAAAIHARAEGNPFYAIEYVRLNILVRRA